MHARTVLALVVGGLAAAGALAVGVWKQAGVGSYGHPAGRVVRAGQHLGVVIQTRDRFLPSLKGTDERDARYSYSLWLIPESGDGDILTIRLDRGVASGARTHNIGAQRFDNGVLWFTIADLQGIDVSSGRRVNTPAPASLVNAPISQLMGANEHPLDGYRARCVTLPNGQWLFIASDDEVKSDLNAGARLYDNADAAGTYKRRTLHTVTAAPGPVPRLATAARLGDREFKNGAFMRSARGGGVVRFTDPDGFLVVHEQGDPVHPTVCLSRLSADGSIVWTADTGIGRLTQMLPHESLPAFVGERPRQLTEPMLSVVSLKDGTARAKSLKGPLN